MPLNNHDLMARPSVQLVQDLTNLSTIICTCIVYIYNLYLHQSTQTRGVRYGGGGEWGGVGQWCSTIARLPHYSQHGDCTSRFSLFTE